MTLAETARVACGILAVSRSVWASRRRASAALAARAALAGTLLLVLGSSACKPYDELAPCNIADEECQLDIYYALLRMRGDGVDPFAGVPPIRTLTVAAYAAELDKADAEAQANSNADADKDVKKPLNSWDVALQLLGFIHPKEPSSEQAKADRVIRVAAFYSSHTRSVTVIDHGDKRNDPYDTILLLHELVHAVQDDEVVRWDGGTTDSSFALSAMIEGEAVMYEEMARFEINGVEPTGEDWDRMFDRKVADKRQSAPTADAPWFDANWFVYSLGGELFIDTYRKGGTAGVRHLLGSAPQRAVELMRNHDQTHGAEPGSLACNAAAPAARFKLAHYDRIGAVKLYSFMAHAGLDENDAWDLALQMRDDQYFVFFDSEAEDVALIWRVRMGTAKQAARIAEGLSGRSDFLVDAIGADVVVRAANHEGLLDDWPASSSCP